MNEVFRKLCESYGPSSNEKAVTDFIKEEIADSVDDIHFDKLGNLIAVKNGGSRKVWIGAAVDTPCFIVTHIEDNGRLKFSIEGFTDTRGAAGAPVVFENGTKGTICSEKEDTPADSRCYFIDIGAGTKTEALDFVKIGSTAVLTGKYSETESTVTAPALHRRAACLCLIDLIKKLPKNDACTLVFAFTTQSVVEARGAKTSAYDHPDIAVSIDDECAGSLVVSGKGPALRLRDHSMVSDSGLVEQIEKAAAQTGTALQETVSGRGYSGVTGVLANGFDTKVASLATPVENIYSSAETVSIGDVNGTATLLAGFIGLL